MEIYLKILAYKIYRVVACVQTDGEIEIEIEREREREG
jgi:hypothetical protein